MSFSIEISRILTELNESNASTIDVSNVKWLIDCSTKDWSLFDEEEKFDVNDKKFETRMSCFSEKQWNRWFCETIDERTFDEKSLMIELNACLNSKKFK